MSPFFSIVLPTYNHAHFLGRAIQSVLNQTNKNWELIIVDNYSEDNTRELVANFNDSRITYLKAENQGVIAKSRNLGIKLSNGDWVAFLDSDDAWYPKKLEVMANSINKFSDDVYCTNELLINKLLKNQKILLHGPSCKNFYRALLEGGNRLSPSATVVRKKFISDKKIFFRERGDFITAEDYDYWLLLAFAGAKFNFINSVHGEYIVHQNNASGKLDLHFKNTENVIKDHVYNLQTYQLNKDELWKYVRARLLMTKSINNFSSGQLWVAMRNLVMAFNSSKCGVLDYFIAKTSQKFHLIGK